MKIEIHNSSKNLIKNKAVLTTLGEDKKLLVFTKGQDYYNMLYPLFKKKIYSSEKDQSIFLYDQNNLDKLLFVSLKGIKNYEEVRHFSANLLNQFKDAEEVEIDFAQVNAFNASLNLESNKFATAFIEGLYFFNYHFTKYLAKPKKSLKKVVLISPATDLKEKVSRTEIINRAYCLAKDLANEPPNILTASKFVEIAKKKAREIKLSYTIFNNRDLRKNKMSAILAVNSGSKEEARLLIMKHLHKQAEKTVLLVGKGVTFDSGGLSLKPSKAMEGMKMDMSGAAAVLGTTLAVRELNLPVNVISLMPLTDNLTGENAFKVGDIIKTYSGKTVEVFNTDAEGRLILADALSYGLKKNKVNYAIDLATLTGACLVALGTHYAGLFSNSQDLRERLTQSGEKSGERVWPLPLDDVYGEELKSNIADLKNIGGAYGGAITAAKFLENFVGKTPWAHLDIASTMEHFQNKGYFKKGGSGFGVRLLVDFFTQLANESK